MTAGKIRKFEGATAVITGGASGIGRALGEALSRRGCDVVLADRQIDVAKVVAQDIRDAGGKASAAELDVRDYAAVQTLVRETHARTGRLDFMFNNAGIAVYGKVEDYGIEDWDKTLEVNLRGVIHGVQAAYPLMVKQGFGHIVNTASIAGLMPTPGDVAYATSKFAVVGLSTSLSAEAAQVGVQVSVLCPGVVRTAILEGGGKYGKPNPRIAPDKLRAAWETMKPIDPDVFAEKALHQIAANQVIIIVPGWWKPILFVDRLSQALSVYISKAYYKRSRKWLGLP